MGVADLAAAAPQGVAMKECLGELDRRSLPGVVAACLGPAIGAGEGVVR